MRPRLLAACVALSWGAALAAQQSGRLPAGSRRAAGGTRRTRRLPARHQAAARSPVRRVPQRHQAQGRPGARDLRGHPRRRQGRPHRPARPQRRQPAPRAPDRRRGREPQMPKDDPPLPAAEIALIARWIDEGVRETPSGPPAPAPWVAPLTLDRPPSPARVWPEWQAPADRLVADYLRRHGQARPALIDDAGSRGAPTSISGACCRPRTTAGVRRRSGQRQARPAGADAARRRRSLRRALDLVLERSAPQRRRRHLLLGERRPQEHHALAAVPR